MAIDNEHWNFIIGALKGTLDTSSQQEFDRWSADPENRRFFARISGIWNDIQRRAAAYEPDRERLWQQLRQRIEAGNAAPQPRVRKRRWMPLLRTAGLIAASVVLTLLVAREWSAASAPEEHRQELHAFGGKSRATLADGSTVWLQNGSSLLFDTRFDRKERRVALHGEGFFEVARDAERPFIVDVKGLHIRVHGTKFNVRTLGDEAVTVSLVEGSVALDAGNGMQQWLRPGEIARYTPSTHDLQIMSGNVELESCWAAGKLVFTQQPLGEICRYLSRWYDIRIDIAPALVHNYAYTFTITDEPLEEILRIMSRINPIAYSFSENNSVSITELE